jgi:OFA family oxalate/formate antiporter-like MFS transporter
MKNISRGWVVTFAGLGVNLVLGVLYAWGVISAALIDQLGWSATMTQIPYLVACAVFALSMIPGGRIQDKLGPKSVIMASAILAGIGFIMSGIFLTVVGLTVFFGIIFGLGMGMGYASPTPAAVKWFSPKKRGLVSGIVVSGFGLAPVYIAPLTNFLLEKVGLQNTFFILGAGFFTVIMLLSQVIVNPPEGYLPEDKTRKELKEEMQEAIPEISQKNVDYEWYHVLKTKQFFLLWTMFTFGTFAGLLIIGQLSKIGLEQASITNASLLVGVYAVFNCTGRIGCGIISDKFGRMRTLMAMFLMQVGVYATFSTFNSPGPMIFGIAVVGFTFGGMLTIFPATTVDYFGIKNFGTNYGMLITAWGVGGVFGPLLGGLVRDLTGTYSLSFIVSGILSLIGAALTLVTKPPVSLPTLDVE